MLGWEYPPHISGGLGTACEGLTRALARFPIDLTFVVPTLHGGEDSPHMSIISPETPLRTATGERRLVGSTTVKKIPAFLSPYWSPKKYAEVLHAVKDNRVAGRRMHYGSNLFDEVHRYAERVAFNLSSADFDVIHAHDWMTYPAGMLLAAVTGKPLVAHVHSLEFDRSGAGLNHEIHHIERLGLEAAQRVIAVSHYTRSVIHDQHDIPVEKVAVVHNGIYDKRTVDHYKKTHWRGEKMVLFLGRITFQKGPDYFVEAAARVLNEEPDASFVMVGSGDMLPFVKERVRALGIEQRFEFPGFLRGAEVEEMYSQACIYVMPSVSEPFGIAPLEAIRCDTPVIISRQSGVSEVLSHALKVDFWDVEKLAFYIASALRYPELRNDLVSMAREEVKRVRWDEAARRTVEVYRELVQ